MPYSIQKRGEKWHVVNSETGEDQGESETEELAKKHLAALYAHEPRRDGLRAVRRFDLLERLDGPKLLPNGWLKAEAFIARTGIQEYRRADGSVRRELRRPEQIFAPDSLASFAMVPVTDGHPPEGLLTAENTARYQRGHLGESVRQDGNKVRASVLITDAELVKEVFAGKQELSCGYTCDLDETPGEWQGQRYDAEQITPHGNHVAVVFAGRAGSEVRVKLDTADAVSIRGDGEAETSTNPAKERPMVKIKVDGIEVEVANEQAAQLIEKSLASRADTAASTEKAAKETRAQLEEVRSELTKEKGRADTLDAKAKAAEKARADAEEPSRITAAVRARIGLETLAREVLGAEAKLDELDDLSVKKAVLAKVVPDLKLDGKDEAYVTSAYDVAMAQAVKSGAQRGLAKARAAAGAPPVRADGSAEERLDAEEIRRRHLRSTEDAWKKPTVGVTA